ncbi:MAG: MarR family transcriptional regulator [Desulfopila sp.]|jgi:DNA-binding MarR family transcriptional regulator|nr:MarR family transcriptional regulator [Desulfopila sp.]
MTTCTNESIGRLIYKTSLNLRNYAERLMDPYGLTAEQFHIMKSTSQTPGLSQNELCRQVGKKPANITRILDRLENKRWIERKPNPADRRSSLVYLSPKGECIIAQVSTAFESYSSWFTAGIDPEEEKVFREVMRKIDGNISNLMAEFDRGKE